jgi:hypothetical protein
MSSQLPDPPGPHRHPGADWHPGADRHACADRHAGADLASYAAGSLGGVAAWSLEAHLTACPQCRVALSTHVDAERLGRNRSVLLVRAVIPDAGPVSRLLRRTGVPEHVLRLLAATPSFRRSWLLAFGGVLSAVTVESVLVAHLWSGAVGLRATGAVLLPFLLIAPLLVLAGVAAAFMPLLDPAYRLTVATPFSGFTLLLIRALSALLAALIPVVVASFVVPGPGWLPAALLLPSLALSAFAVAAATTIGPGGAAILSAALWVSPLLVLTVANPAVANPVANPAFANPALALVQWHVQAACAVVLLGAIAVLLLRRDRFEMGWAR